MCVLLFCLVLVAAGRGDPHKAAGAYPYQHTRLWLFDFPSLSLLDLMVPTAQRDQIALARDPAVVVRDGVVQVARGSGPPAAGRGAPGVPGLDQVPELAAGRVTGLDVRVQARTRGDRGELTWPFRPRTRRSRDSRSSWNLRSSTSSQARPLTRPT